MTTRSFPTKPFLMSCLATVLSSFLFATSGHTQSGSKTDEITQLYCGDGGKIVMCIGRSPSQCTEIVRPFVEKCEQDVRDVAETARAQKFDECFHKDFYGKYGKDLMQTSVCVSYPQAEGEIKPPPPEFAVKGTPFPFGQPMPETETPAQ